MVIWSIGAYFEPHGKMRYSAEMVDGSCYEFTDDGSLALKIEFKEDGCFDAALSIAIAGTKTRDTYENQLASSLLKIGA